MTAAVLLFLGGTIACGLAQNFTVILAGRAIQGAGGGGIVVVTEIVVCDLIPLRDRGTWFGVLSSMYAVGTVFGPMIGGALTANLSWVSFPCSFLKHNRLIALQRWVFWINLPFIGISLVMTPLFLKTQVVPSSLAQKLARIDWGGAAIFIGSAIGFIMAISWGGVQYAWTSYQTLLPLILGMAGFVAFYFYEEYVPAEPMIHMGIFKVRNATAAYTDTILLNILVLALVYYLPLYYQGVKGFNTIITGVAVFPETLTVAPASVIIGTAISKIGTYKWAVWLGWLVSILGLGILYLLDVNTTTVQWIFINIAAGVGTGILYPALQFAVQAPMSDEDLPSAVAMFSFFRALGQTLGIAIGGTIVQNELYTKISAHPELAPMAAAYSKDASALAQIIWTMPEGAARTDLIQAYADALKVVWVVMCGLAGLGFLIGLLIRDYPLDRLLAGEQRQPEGDTERILGWHRKGASVQSFTLPALETQTEIDLLFSALRVQRLQSVDRL